MYSDHFWICLEGLSFSLDGTSQEIENSLAAFERAYLKFPTTRRADVMRQLNPIVAGLTELNRRLSLHGR